MSVNGLGQVSLLVRETDRAVAFDRDVLGLPHLVQEWMAFFEDTEGNTLALMSSVATND